MIDIMLGTLLILGLAPILLTAALWLICAYIELFWWVIRLTLNLALTIYRSFFNVLNESVSFLLRLHWKD